MSNLRPPQVSMRTIYATTFFAILMSGQLANGQVNNLRSFGTDVTSSSEPPTAPQEQAPLPEHSVLHQMSSVEQSSAEQFSVEQQPQPQPSVDPEFESVLASTTLIEGTEKKGGVASNAERPSISAVVSKMVTSTILVLCLCVAALFALKKLKMFGRLNPESKSLISEEVEMRVVGRMRLRGNRIMELVQVDDYRLVIVSDNNGVQSVQQILSDSNWMADVNNGDEQPKSKPQFPLPAELSTTTRIPMPQL